MVSFHMTVSRMTATSALLSVGKSEMMFSEDNKFLRFIPENNRPGLEVPVGNIKKMSPTPRSPTATAIHLDVENFPDATQVKLIFANCELLRAAHAHLATVIGIAEKKGNSKLLSSTHLHKLKGASPRSRQLERANISSSRPGSSLSSYRPNTQPTQTTSPRISGTLSTASSQPKPLTNAGQAKYQVMEPLVSILPKKPQKEECVNDVDNYDLSILDKIDTPTMPSQRFSGRQSSSLSAGKMVFPNTSTSSGNKLVIKPRGKGVTPGAQKSTRKRPNSASVYDVPEHEHSIWNNSRRNKIQREEVDEYNSVWPSAPLNSSDNHMDLKFSPVKREPELVHIDDEREDFDVFLDGPFSFRGMKNLGNSCYMNASLQALASSPDFVRRLRHVAAGPSKNLSNNHSNLLVHLNEVYVTMFKGNPKKRRLHNNVAQSPAKISQGLLRKLRVAAGEQLDADFASTSQQDAHEFLFALLDNLKEEVNGRNERPSGSPSSDKENGPPELTAFGNDEFDQKPSELDQQPIGDEPKPKIKEDECRDDLKALLDMEPSDLPVCSRNPSDLFSFKGVGKTACINCDHSGEKEEDSIDCQLGMREGDWSIKSLMVKQFARDRISDYTCAKCKASGTGYVTTAFRTLPENLVVVLKRYNYCRETKRSTKCGNEITVERELYLSDLCEDSQWKRDESALRTPIIDIAGVSSEMKDNDHVSPVKKTSVSDEKEQGGSPLKGLQSFISPWKSRRVSALQESEQTQHSVADVFDPTQDLKESQDPKEPKDSQESMDCQDSNEFKESQDLKESQEPKKEFQDSNEFMESLDSNQFKESREPKQESQDSMEMEFQDSDDLKELMKECLDSTETQASDEDLFSSQSQDINKEQEEGVKKEVDEEMKKEEEDEGIDAVQEDEAMESDLSLELGDSGTPDAATPMPTIEEPMGPVNRESSSPEDAAGLRQTGGGTAEFQGLSDHANSPEVPEDPAPRRTDSDESVVVTSQSPSSNKTIQWFPVTVDNIIRVQDDMDYIVTDRKSIKGWQSVNLRTSRRQMPLKGQIPEQVHIEGDGNCLFRCISWWLFNGDQNHHDMVRARVVGFMRRNKARFEQHVEWDMGIDNYLDFKKNEGEWGTDVEIMAMATMFRCVIYSFFKKTWTVFKPLFTFEKAYVNKYEMTEEEVDWEAEVREHGAIYLINNGNVHFNVVTGPMLGEAEGGCTPRPDDEEENRHSPKHHQSYDDLDDCKPRSPRHSPSPFDDDYGLFQAKKVEPLTAAPYEFKQEDDPVYTLTAVVNHQGESLRYGHYTAYAYDCQRNIWLDCNDSCISKVDESEVLSRAARQGYMFVYRRRHAGDAHQFRPSTHDFNAH